MAQGKTQNERLLELLQERGELGVTPLLALDRLGIMRLAARVADLRADGHPIDTRHDYDPRRERRRPEATYVLRRVQPMSELELRFAWGDR